MSRDRGEERENGEDHAAVVKGQDFNGVGNNERKPNVQTMWGDLQEQTERDESHVEGAVHP